MIPRSRGRLRTAIVALAATTVLGACGAAGPSFDPAGPCVVDGRAEGAYPQLEAAIPVAFRGKAPTRLDSGRTCSPKNLGTLADEGVTEVRFAGGLWTVADRSGVTIARFSAPALEAAWMAEFYEAGARAAPKTEQVETSEFRIGNREAWRLDTLNDESFQTIVVWPAAEPGAVWVVLAGNDIREIETRAAHEAVVGDAIAAVGP